jgi:hypothetical protein
VSESNGIDQASFIYKKKAQLKIDTESATALREIHAENDDAVPQIVTAHIVVHGPILDTKARRWKFRIGGRVESVDIGETNIASESLARGGVSVGDTYKVKIEMTERQTAAGAYTVDYRVKEVLQFIPGRGRIQGELPIEPPEDYDKGGRGL